MFEDEGETDTEDQADRDRHDAEEEELADDYERRVPVEARALQGINCIKQDDRDDVVEDTLAEDARVELGLSFVADDGHCGDDIGRAEQGCEEENAHNVDVDGHWSSILAIVVHGVVDHLEASIFDRGITHHRIDREADKSDAKSKNGDITDILEELLSAHVEARVKNDGRQEEVEEEVLLKLVDFSSILAEADPEDQGDHDAQNDRKAGLMATTRLILFIACSHDKEKEHHDEKYAIEFHIFDLDKLGIFLLTKSLSNQFFRRHWPDYILVGVFKQCGEISGYQCSTTFL